MDFLTYHIESSKIRDIDPANDCLLYIANRFELTIEQRYWIAFLYSCSYCAPTVFYMYNEFPDFENVNVGRLNRWWNANKQKTVFQTDRLKIKTMNKFVETYESYKQLLGGVKQEEFFNKLAADSPVNNYRSAYKKLANIRNVGRFTLFIYLEMVSVLTKFNCVPDRLEWKFADNCRKGLCYSIGLEDVEVSRYPWLDKEMGKILEELKTAGCEHSNIFNVETTLCAYKKYKHGKRYIGYYLDRQLQEINKMKSRVTAGVAWRVMDEFREETYKHLPYGNLFNNRGNGHRENLGDAGANKGIGYQQHLFV